MSNIFRNLFFNLNSYHYLTLEDYYHISCLNKTHTHLILNNPNLWYQLVRLGIYSSTLWWNQGLVNASKSETNGTFSRIAHCPYGENQYIEEHITLAHNPIRYQFSPEQIHRLKYGAPYSGADILTYYLKPIVYEFILVQTTIDFWIRSRYQTIQAHHENLQEIYDLYQQSKEHSKTITFLKTCEQYLLWKDKTIRIVCLQLKRILPIIKK